MVRLQAVSKHGWLEGGGGRDPGKGAGKKIEAAYIPTLHHRIASLKRIILPAEYFPCKTFFSMLECITQKMRSAFVPPLN
jgi:hypothetical protein